MTSHSAKVPLPIVLILVSFLCPTEFSLYIAGLRMPPHRLALIVLLPVAIAKLAGGRDQKIRSFDVLFILYGLWTLGIYTYHSGKEGFVYGGSLALEALGGYFVARAFIRTTEQLRATMRAFMAAVIVAALIALPETLLGQIFTHDLLRQLTGYAHPIGIETRLGLTRAYGTFDHPIHYGTFVAALLAMFWFAERRALMRNMNAGIMTLATILGLSSAPLLCLGLQVMMLIWERVTRIINRRMALTLTALAGLYVIASMVGNRTPIQFIATGMTIDPWTGFYRLQIWENGLDNVWAHPWTGIGLNDWLRPSWMVSDTVDAYWLVTMMRQGLPALFLLTLAIVLLGYGVMKRRHRHAGSEAKRIAMGWMMSLIALSLIGATVHYWNVLHAFFFFFIGLGAWIADPSRAATASIAGKVKSGGPGKQPAGRERLRPQPIYGRPYGHPGGYGAIAVHARPYGLAR